jgi:integrase
MACVKKIGDRYRADWRDKKGNRYRKMFDLKKDAQDHLANVKVEMKAGTYVAPKQVPTLRELAEQWFANKQGMKLRPATLSCYRVNLDRHILRADFADARLDKIGVGDVIAFRNQLTAKPVRNGGAATLAAKTVNYVMRDIEAIFAYAMKARLASWNPGSCVDRIKEGSGEHGEDGAERTDVAVTADEVLSPADCRKLIDNANEGFDRAFLMLAVMTGARHDELLALKWSDIDLDAGAIHVRRSLSWAKLPGEPTRPKFFDTKTGKRGNRKLPCPPELALTLKKWRLQCPKGELDLVFPTPSGQPQHRSRILDCVLRPTLERAELPKHFHIHTLRHSFCSALLAQGTPPTEVQRYSGHARLSTLLDVYSHFIPSEQTGSIDRLASKVLG